MTLRSKVAMLVAEFLGTGVLAMAVINVARSQIGIGYFVAFSAAIAYAVNLMVLGPTSGGHFNPAVTIGMWTLRRIQTVQALAYLAVQMLGGFSAWRLAEYMTNDTLVNIAGKSFEWRAFVAETLGALIFTFGIAAAVYRRYEGGRLAATIGASLFAGVIVATAGSNALLNPAVALANQSWGRAYIFGPILGAVLGMNLYAMLFADRAPVVSVQKASATRGSRSSAKKPASRSRTRRK